ncbi:MAG: PmoA family protein, partial [Verrucomicrobia bacterium]|nr:PmoA family protein [Verrucomicrobiota bacterium]
MKQLFSILLLLVTTSAALQAQSWELESTDSGVTVKLNGELFTKYVTDQANKPYFYPIIGPTGADMTRHYPMKDVEGERQDHPHHRGINFGHHQVNGFNTWLERESLVGKIKDKSPEEAEKIL